MRLPVWGLLAVVLGASAALATGSATPARGDATGEHAPAAAPTDEAALSQDRCAWLFSRIAREDAEALQTEDRFIQELQEELARSGLLLGEAEEVGFRAAYQLRPLFDNGIVHRAVAAQLAAEGKIDAARAESSLRVFVHQTDPRRQLAFVEGVVMRIRQAIPDSVSFETDDELIRLARAFKEKDVEKVAEFVNLWRDINRERPDEVRLVLLLKLFERNADFIRQVRASSGWLRFVLAKLVRDPMRDLPAIPRANGDVPMRELLIGAKKVIEDKPLLAYLGQVRPTIAEDYLRQQLLWLGADQLAAVQGLAIHAELTEGMKTRIEEQRARKRAVLDLQAAIAALQKQLADAQARLAQVQGVTTQGAHAYSWETISKTLTNMPDASDNAGDARILGIIKDVFGRHAGQMASAEFRDAALLVIQSRRPCYRSNIVTNLRWIKYYTTQAPRLTPEDLVAIQGAMVERGNGLGGDTMAEVASIVHSAGWGVESQLPEDREALEALVARLDADVAAKSADLETRIAAFEAESEQKLKAKAAREASLAPEALRAEASRPRVEPTTAAEEPAPQVQINGVSGQ